VKTQTKDRIYEAIVIIYESVDTVNYSEKYKKVLFTLKSSREQ
jgi:hypothetical protein